MTSSSRIEPPSASFEPAGAIGVGAGERAAFVAEQFAFGELRGEHRAVEADQRAGRSPAEGVDGLGDQFLAGAAFAADEHGFVGGGDLGDSLAQLAASRALLPIIDGGESREQGAGVLRTRALRCLAAPYEPLASQACATDRSSCTASNGFSM